MWDDLKKRFCIRKVKNIQFTCKRVIEKKLILNAILKKRDYFGWTILLVSDFANSFDYQK